MTNSSYLAIDPGITSGWAIFDEQGNVLNYGQFKLDEVDDAIPELIHEKLIAVICEDYRNHGWMQQKKWSRNDTSKIIGRIEAIAALRKVPVHLQPNTVKAIGYKWAGLNEAPSNHSISHQFDAVAHGVYWLQKNNIRPVGKAIQND